MRNRRETYWLTSYQISGFGIATIRHWGPTQGSSQSLVGELELLRERSYCARAS